MTHCEIHGRAGQGHNFHHDFTTGLSVGLRGRTEGSCPLSGSSLPGARPDSTVGRPSSYLATCLVTRRGAGPGVDAFRVARCRPRPRPRPVNVIGCRRQPPPSSGGGGAHPETTVSTASTSRRRLQCPPSRPTRVVGDRLTCRRLLLTATRRRLAMTWCQPAVLPVR